MKKKRLPAITININSLVEKIEIHSGNVSDSVPSEQYPRTRSTFASTKKTFSRKRNAKHRVDENDTTSLRHLLNGKSLIRLSEEQLEKCLRRRDQVVLCGIVHEKDLQTRLGRLIVSNADLYCPIVIVF